MARCSSIRQNPHRNTPVAGFRACSRFFYPEQNIFYGIRLRRLSSYQIGKRMLVSANALLQQIPGLFRPGIWSSLCILCLFACQTSPPPPEPSPPAFRLHTAYSHLPNSYQNFSSPQAINAIAAMENEHFRAYENGLSRYYGTLWREQGPERYDDYSRDLGEPGDSMHCTIMPSKPWKQGWENALLRWSNPINGSGRIESMLAGVWAICW